MSDGRESAHEGLTEVPATENLPSPKGEVGRADARLPLPEGSLEIINRLIEVQAELDARKVFYQEYNELVMKLVGLGFVSADLGSVGTVNLVDNFARGNTAWTSAAVQRFEIEVVSPELQAKREKRKAKGKSNE